MYYIKKLNTKHPNGYNLTDGGEGSIGCIVSDETRKKLSKAMKGKFAGEKNPMYGKKREGSKLTKAVYQYTLDNQLIKKWKSTSEAARELCLSRCSIRDCCHGGIFHTYKGEKRWYNRTQCGGYKWSYEPL